tara:strand:+ start:240 stop:584 length:345 start_codon:yes stop_codon:yes gene_type:complete
MILYNNDPAGEGQDVVDLPRRNGQHHNKCNKATDEWYGAWESGKTYWSAWFIGYQSGSNITRIGLNHESAQDLFQNNIHLHFFLGYQNFYQDYSEFTRGSYIYNGFNNPHSMYN